MAVNTYRVKLYCFALGVGISAKFRVRSKRRALALTRQEFFKKYPQALKRRLSVGGSVTRVLPLNSKSERAMLTAALAELELAEKRGNFFDATKTEAFERYADACDETFRAQLAKVTPAQLKRIFVT